ncbi:MAG TPA: SAM-dependent methyltransferase [Acidimicrobiaceae bacterium]|nr:SAM-dependent methyltransferase [Acidimicrobiaceae bacterium]
MLTVDYERLGARRGETLLDVGCGHGRHSFEGARLGCRVVALDRDVDDLRKIAAGLDDVGLNGTAPAGAAAGTPAAGTANAIAADAIALPFPDACFDRVVASEVLEHIDDDSKALRELARVLRPGGSLAVSVPAWLAERVCWGLSREYHAPFVRGGHLRIYTAPELAAKLSGAGLVVEGRHGAHSLHAPYWWLRCAVGPENDEHRLVAAYHRFLVWDMMAGPRLTRTLDRLLNPVLAKSLVMYAGKPDD